MIKNIFRKSLLVFFCVCFHAVSAQLPDFTLQVTTVDESCTGNASLAFSTANTAPGATIIYTIYLLPNTVTPIATQSESALAGLSAGNYRIVATQTLGNESNFEQQDVTITTTVENLAYQLSGSVSCNDGIITVNITAGNPFQYEIISGPVTRPLQSSNVFASLQSGVYVIRVVDICGDALVQTFTLQNSAAHYQLSNISLPDCPLVNCNTAGTTVQLSADPVTATINYPLLVQYTVHSPSGGVEQFSQTIASGSTPLDILMDLPYYDQTYTIDVKVTDSCGNIITNNGTAITAPFVAFVQSSTSLCSRNIVIDACQFVPPFTVDFVSAPAGFNPLLFNSNHPGPHAILPISYVSTQTDALPIGSYTIKVTDGCGRIAQSTLEVEESNEPNYTMVPHSCGFGQVGMPGQNGTFVATVIITAAPAAYDHTLPHNVSSYITGGMFNMILPMGTYTFTVISVCGISYEYTITIPSSNQQAVLFTNIKGCDVGFGSIKLSFQQIKLDVITITAAPATFTQTLPYNATANIFEGIFYMNDLPQGTYTFHLQDECGGERNITINVPGYQILTNNISVQENCGSFNIALDYSVNEAAVHFYWLQRYNPFGGYWEHPVTGAQYLEGTEPMAANSLLIDNHSTTLNIASVGTFRLIRVHGIFSNGSKEVTLCIKSIKEFVFTGGPTISDAYALPCISNPGQVVIVANGLAPLRYFITSKDGQPFYVDNNNSNIFTGLTPGVYNFQVRDRCQNIVNRLFDFGSVPPPNISQSILCNGQNGQLSVQNFDFLSYQWWHTDNPDNILSTNNILNFTPFSDTAHTGTYYVRIYSGQPGLCTDYIVSYTIPAAGNNPNAGEDTATDICGNTGTIDLFSLLGGTFNSGGNWQEITNSGMQVGHSWLPLNIPFGTYRFKYLVDGLCGTSDEAMVTIHFNPATPAPVATATPSVCSLQSIALSATNIANATYAWSGPNNFTSTQQNPVIDNATALAAGTYSVTATVGNCPSPPATVVVNVVPSPDFTIKGGCDANVYSITVTPKLNSFDQSNVTYSWTGPNGYTSNDNPIVITGKEKGSYSVTVTTPDGCAHTGSMEVLNTLCGFPSGISPNHDGDNEFFDLTGFDVLRFKVFNRYGRIVFEQDDYTNQWHGQDFKGRDLPDATYYYYVKMKTGEEKTGWVYVTK